MPPSPPARPSAEGLLVEHAEEDLERGIARIRARVREAHGPFVGSTMDALVVGAVATLRLRARRREDARFLISLARRVQAGEDPRAIAEEHVDDVLRLRDSMASLVRSHDPDLQPARALALDLFARRLPDLARLASVDDPRDYDDLVRRAFPERSHVEEVVEDNARTVAAMVDHLERHPHLLHAPRSLTPKLASIARDMVAWTTREARRGIDEIYKPSTTGRTP